MSDPAPRGEGPAPDTGEYVAFDELAARFYEVEPSTQVRVELGAYSHPGKVRPNNEDSYLVVRRARSREVLLSSLGEGVLRPSEQCAYTLAVADGMGGQRFGEIASLLALRSGWELGGGEVKWTMKVNEREAEELERKARVFFGLIDRTIRAEADQNPRLRGMGTTLTLCYTTGPELFVMHAGDSRAYLLRGREVRRLTVDHSLAQRLVETGMAEPGSPEERRARRVLTSSLGAGKAEVQVDFSHHELEDGDVLLLCTDGLTDLVDDGEIAEQLDLFPSPDAACHALVELVLDRGGRDNVTVVVARYNFISGPPHVVSES
jgi:serine/threonine protein phosphatase PrpC